MHLESCVELNSIVINPVLDENYTLYIQQFRDTFDLCHSSGLLNETEKCHHVYAPWHLEEEIRRTGMSLWAHDTSGVEKTHSTYVSFQKEHGFECTKTIGINKTKYCEAPTNMTLWVCLLMSRISDKNAI